VGVALLITFTKHVEDDDDDDEEEEKVGIGRRRVRDRIKKNYIFSKKKIWLFVLR
jgi:hypothetical protein